jgi:ankyrin repeat protein
MKQFFDAIHSGDVSAVQALLDQNPELVRITNESGVPALTEAVYRRQPEIVAVLENRGAKTDLFSASMLGRAESLRDTLAAAPDGVNSFSPDGWTPLHLATFFGQRECVELLLNAGAKVNERSTNAMQNMPLHAAAAGRHAEIVRLLLERGAWVNARQHGGWTALHAAAQNGDTTLVELLIAAGADVKARADNNQNALDLALTKGHQQMVEMLEHYGASE